MVRGLYYERLKTWLLVILVAVSVILTWELWTYQPDIAIQNTETVELNPIGEEKSIRDVVRPNKVVKHQEDQTTIVLENEPAFNQIYDRMLDAEIYDMKFFPSSNVSTGIEIVFPDTVPMSMFMNLFSQNRETEEEIMPLIGVDRLLLYENENEGTRLQVYSRTENKRIEIGLSNLDQDIQRFLEEDNSVAALTVNEPDEDTFILDQQNIYVPAEEIQVNSASYSTERVSKNDITPLLFSDPVSVRSYRQSNGELTYTDGTRILNLRDDEDFMTYRNSSSAEVTNGSSSTVPSIPQSSFDYINSQAGWTNNYILSWWRATEDRENAIYRLYMNNLPIYNYKDSSDNMTLSVEKKGSQITNYTRPLLVLDNSPINPVAETLPSGASIINRLKSAERLNMNEIRDVRIGYEMIEEDDRLGLVALKPYWFILAENGWQKVPDTEEGNNELE